MIYFVTHQEEPYGINSSAYQIISVEESLQLLNKLTYIGLDTETSSLDVHSGNLLTLQLGNKDFQVVIDCTTIDVKQYKAFLESDKTFIIHNAKFDLQWLYKENIIIKNIFDTFLAEKLLYLGFTPGFPSMSLQACCKRYLNIELDKSVRKTIRNKITEEIIDYAAHDVVYLEDIMKIQEEILKSRNEIIQAQIENSFVRVLAYIEYCGLKMDEEKWKIKMQKDIEEKERKKEELDEWVIGWVLKENMPIVEHFDETMKVDELIVKKGIFVAKPIPSLFEETKEYKCIINWKSPLHVVKLFKTLGFDLTAKDKKTGKYKSSADKKILSKQLSKSTITPIYIRYSEAEKNVSSFGETFLKAINPATGRIHAPFNQLLATGRMSCGKKGEKGSVNLQQLPNNDDTRGAFIAEEGNLLIDIDYGDQEGHLFTEHTNDQEWIKFYNDPAKRDGHSFVAKMCFPKELADVEEKDVKSVRKDLRDISKKARFCFNYNGSAETAATNIGISVELAKEVYKNYFERFKGIADYFKVQKKLLWERGYILICPLTGLRSWVYNYPILKGIESRMKKIKSFWDMYRNYKESKILIRNVPQAVSYQIAKEFSENTPLDSLDKIYVYKVKADKDTEELTLFEDEISEETVETKEASIYINKETAVVEAVRYYFKEKSEWENSCCNFPTQGTSAVMTKIAGIKYFNHLVEDNLLFKVKIVNAVHDEYLLEVPKELVEQEAEIIKNFMEWSAKIFCKKVTINAVPEWADHWVH